MGSTLKQFRSRALARPDLRKAYDELDEEFAFLDEVLKARAEAGLTQAEVAARIGTTKSAIARLDRLNRSTRRPSQLCRSTQRPSAIEFRFAL